MNLANDILLDVRDLQTQFQTDDSVLKAVDHVSFSVKRGETVGIVGESGCGKSVTAKSIIQTLPFPKAKIAGGEILYQRNDKVINLAELDPRGSAMRSIRGNEISMIFQEPMTSLNPVYTIGTQIIETIRLHQKVTKRQAREQAIEMLDKVGISAPSRRVDQYPHEFSGGMRQRAMIAMALSCRPNLLIADEPTTALDVTVEAQILNLIMDLQHEMGMSMIMITHDLGVIAGVSNRVVVMYSGWVVEQGPVKEIFAAPKHPYTRGLLASIPQIGEERSLVPITGTVPTLQSLSEGWCYFAPRCPHADDRCANFEPDSYQISEEHTVKCWLYAEKESMI